jgi:hypothetical protein
MAVESLEEVLARWNKPPTDDRLLMLVGVPTEEGDGRATGHVDHPLTGTIEDNTVKYGDDLDPADDEDDEDVVDDRVPYEARTNAELKDELRKRDLPVSGNHDELVARLEEDDESDEDDEGDES